MDHVIFIVGQSLIGLFYIITAVTNIRGFKRQVASLERTIIPYPTMAFIIALILQMGGGLLLFFNYHSHFGAFAVMLFTVLASAFFMRFWEIKDNPGKRMMSFMFFFEHVAVVGALLMILSLK